jgi:hypothetical protein
MICKYSSICESYDPKSYVCISETLQCFLRDELEIKEKSLDKFVLRKGDSPQIPSKLDFNN